MAIVAFCAFSSFPALLLLSLIKLSLTWYDLVDCYEFSLKPVRRRHGMPDNLA